MADEVRDWTVKWNLLVADAWEDDALMKRLQADPAAVLKERGIKPGDGVTIKVLADSEKVAHLVVPLKPTARELSEAELSTVSAGHSFHSHHSGGCGGCGGCGGGGGGCGGCHHSHHSHH